ncbi:hypothetical protein Taro_004756 [Colocasia esculenta]|uniref:Uncharacterized protein n=1 Tax=Colocasia esculenta TaxID=4460 RepID=A0A843TQF2_COLES|nr:hypothetical protein [Colocasia esculenta]
MHHKENLSNEKNIVGIELQIESYFSRKEKNRPSSNRREAATAVSDSAATGPMMGTVTAAKNERKRRQGPRKEGDPGMNMENGTGLAQESARADPNLNRADSRSESARISLSGAWMAESGRLGESDPADPDSGRVGSLDPADSNGVWPTLGRPGLKKVNKGILKPCPKRILKVT